MWQAIEPLFLEAVASLITVAIGVGAFYLRAWTGIQIDDKAKRDLNDALNSGAIAATKHGPAAGIETLKAHAIAYARQSVPGAMRRLVPGETVLDDLAEKYVREAMLRFGLPPIN